MKLDEDIYMPQEDSYLLYNSIINDFDFNKDNLNICEVGVGSGYIINNIAKKYSNNNFFGSDINSFAIDFTKDLFDKNNLDIDLNNCSLFDNFNKDQLFDLIIFNPPYLPFENKSDSFEKLELIDKALYGGKNGYEITIDFIKCLYNKLSSNGFAYILISSYTNIDYILSFLEENNFIGEIISKENHFFEELVVIKIKKDEFLKDLLKNNIKDLKYYTKGKHSKIFLGNYNKNVCIIKKGLNQHILKENYFLDYLKNEPYTPKIYFRSKNYVVMEFIEGFLIKDLIKDDNFDSILIKKVLDEILKITQRLDQLGINKSELINPYKHIFIKIDQKNVKIKFIDFERSIFTLKPKNTTQFMQYLLRIKEDLLKKNIIIDQKKIFEISKNYKKNLKENKNIHVYDLIKK